ncbi:hypothetical protein [Brumimicrobium mesophilum]|uniref:hypothetical protein n=1 Tax=Brumimicrobium mesophilum TaxID=392717 RepID=UPI00131C0B4A|nr:hypothetical protein [Brumimicrobium mesophilum]
MRLIILLYVSLCLVSCDNKQKENGDSKKEEIDWAETDTIIITRRYIDSSFQKSSTHRRFILQKNESLDHIKILNKFYKQSDNFVFTSDSNSIYELGEYSSSINGLLFIQYNLNFNIYNNDSLGAIYIAGNRLIEEEYYISYHSSINRIWLDSNVNSLRAYNKSRNKAMFPLVEE